MAAHRFQMAYHPHPQELKMKVKSPPPTREYTKILRLIDQFNEVKL